jgi:GNAT superfamily N-acetyltransferase
MPDVVVDHGRKQELRDVAAKRAIATVLVAVAGGQVVGTVAIFRPGAPESEAWLPNMADLRHLAVDPSFQGRGITRPLLDRAEAIVRGEWKASGICLHVRRGAVGVARLYESRGFVREPSGDFAKPTVTLDAYVLRF